METQKGQLAAPCGIALFRGAKRCRGCGEAVELD